MHQLVDLARQLICCRARQVYQDLAPMLFQPCEHVDLETVPMSMSCGVYNLGPNQQNRCVPTFAKNKDQSDASSKDCIGEDTCRKRTYTENKHQCMLHFFVCLVHETIVGWHLGEHEGRRDVMLPIYRYFPKAPKLIMYDFACGSVHLLAVRDHALIAFH